MKQIGPIRDEVDLPHIRIEAIELIELLERVSGGKYEVTATCSNVIFNDIEEMKAHLALFAQNPTIKLGPLVLRTRGDWMSPTLHIDSSELQRNEVGYTISEAQIVMHSLEAELTRYKRRLASPSVRQQSGILIVVGVLWAVFTIITNLIRFVWVSPTRPISEDFSTTIAALVLILLGASWAYLVEPVLTMVVGENTVFYQPRETWWHRHSRELFSGVFSAAIVALIGAVLHFY